jgi:hypothetical protein
MDTVPLINHSDKYAPRYAQMVSLRSYIKQDAPAAGIDMTKFKIDGWVSEK